MTFICVLAVMICLGGGGEGGRSRVQSCNNNQQEISYFANTVIER